MFASKYALGTELFDDIDGPLARSDIVVIMGHIQLITFSKIAVIFQIMNLL